MNAPLERETDKKQRTQRTGLRRALFSALFLALVLPGIVAVVILIQLNLQRALDVDARIRAEKFAEFLQAGLVMPMWQVAPELGQPLLEAVATDPAVASIDVFDHDKRKVLAFKRDLATPENPIVVSRDIEREGERLGQVRVTYATASARDDAMHASLLLLAVIMAQLLVSLALIGAWLTRRVLRPLDVLRASAETISAGNLQRAVPTLPRDEFGVLASTLDSMRHSLAQSVTQLEERVDERTCELREVNSRLQGTLEDLRRTQGCLVQSEKLASLGSLVAGVAHELNTPIGTSVTVVSTISEHCADLRRQLDEGIRRSQLDAFLNDVEKGSALAQASLQRAAHLIQDFKQVAVDQTSARRRRFALAEIVRETMAALKLRHKRSLARFAVQVPDGIEMDSYPGAIEQILANLVENAMVHGFDGRAQCTIEITAEVDATRVRLQVADNGNGIPPEHLSHIFDPFFTTRLGQGGSGLGLSIAYGLANGMLGGQISVVSEPGQGATFTLDLPREAPVRPELGAE